VAHQGSSCLLSTNRSVYLSLLGSLLDLAGTTFALTNTGYTLKATPATSGTLTFDGTTYTLLQFHFHTLSEHTNKGQHSVMELHAVFQDENSNLAVIGIMYRIGKLNRFLAKILSAVYRRRRRRNRLA
jgi:carbonic anhydrase